MRAKSLVAIITTIICLLTLIGPTMAQESSSSGIVGSVVKAPVAVDGDVVGAATDFVINLAVDMDPAVPGKTLAKGHSIRIILPHGFVFPDQTSFPLQNLFGAADCVAGNLKCSTAVMLHGWPQHPILPSFPPGGDPQYSLSFESDTNTLVFTADVDIAGVPLPGPGIKQLHLILLGFRNPDKPGRYPIHVSIVDAEGKELESGTGDLHIKPGPAPSINVTSVFVPGDVKGGKPPNPNTIYQTTKPNAAAPMPWDFLMWDSDGAPHTGVEIVQIDASGGQLTRDGKVVGRFKINAPKGATGQKVTGEPSIKMPGTPVIGNSFGAPIPSGRLTAMFTAGSTPGRYVTTFEMNGGNSVSMVVDVGATD